MVLVLLISTLSSLKAASSPPSPPSPPPVGAPPSGCGKKTAWAAVQDGDIITFDYEFSEPQESGTFSGLWWLDLQPATIEPQLMYDKRLELDRTKLNVLVYEGSSGGSYQIPSSAWSEFFSYPTYEAKVQYHWEQRADVFARRPTAGRCQAVCAWAPTFFEETGIKIKVHCWQFVGYEYKLLEADRACRCNAEYEEYAGNLYLIGSEVHNSFWAWAMGQDADLWSPSPANGAGFGFGPATVAAALPSMRRAMSYGMFAGMDVYDNLPTGVAVDLALGDTHRVGNEHVFADLSPFLAHGFVQSLTLDPPLADVEGEMLPILRGTYMTSGDGFIGLPSGLSAVRLVHNPQWVKLGAASTWDEYIAELQRLDGVDRDGDGVGDRAFCLLKGYTEWQSRLFEIIAGSLFQVEGPQDIRYFDTTDPDLPNQFNTPAMQETIRIFRAIFGGLTRLEPSGREPAGDADADFRSGACVATVSSLSVVDRATATAVGSLAVHSRATGQLQTCSRKVCPRARRTVDADGSERWINLAPTLIEGAFHQSIDAHTLLAEEAWAWMSFVQHPEVQYSMLVQGTQLPVLSSHFDVESWGRYMAVAAGESANGTLEAAAAAANQNGAVVRELRQYTGLASYLEGLRAVVTDPLGPAVLLSSLLPTLHVDGAAGWASIVEGVNINDYALSLVAASEADYTSWMNPSRWTCSEDEIDADSDCVAEITACRTSLTNSYSYAIVSTLEDSDVGYLDITNCTNYSYTQWGPRTPFQSWAARLGPPPDPGNRLAGQMHKVAAKVAAIRRSFEQLLFAVEENSSRVDPSLLCTQPCMLGYSKRSVCGDSCEPCPAGFMGVDVKQVYQTGSALVASNETATVASCQKCAMGKYQPSKGKLRCVACPTATHTTGRDGATSLEECIVPAFKLRPTLPRGCLPPSCTDGPTTVDFFYRLLGTEEPDADARQLAVRILMELSWRDPRLTLHPIVGKLLLAQRVRADGSRKLTLTTAEWREHGLWLPRYSVKNSIAGFTGALASDDDVELSNVTVIMSALAEGDAPLWPQQLASIECSWSRVLGSDGGEPAVMKWALSFHMFPFGSNAMSIDFRCKAEARCVFQTVARHGPYASLGTASGASASNSTSAANASVSLYGNSSGQRARRSLRAAKVVAVSPLLASRSATFPESMPLVPNTLEHVQLQEGSFRLSFTMRREAMLQLVRLIIPTVLILLLGLVVFFVEDATWTVDNMINVLLVISVISVEVKDFFPSWVTYMSWLDLFVLLNLVIVVQGAFLGICCIILSERESEFYQGLGVALDEAISLTQPLAALVLNMLVIFFTRDDTPGKDGSIATVWSVVVYGLLSNAVALALLFAAKVLSRQQSCCAAGRPVAAASSSLVECLRRVRGRRRGKVKQVAGFKGEGGAEVVPAEVAAEGSMSGAASGALGPRPLPAPAVVQASTPTAVANAQRWETTDDMLREAGLEGYLTALRSSGFDEPREVARALNVQGHAAVQALLQQAGLKPGHAMKLISACFDSTPISTSSRALDLLAA